MNPWTVTRVVGVPTDPPSLWAIWTPHGQEAAEVCLQLSLISMVEHGLAEFTDELDDR